MPTMDDIFGEYEAECLKKIEKEDTDSVVIARREKKRREEVEKEIRQGLCDANGDWFEQPEIEDDEEDGDGEFDDQEESE